MLPRSPSEHLAVDAIAFDMDGTLIDSTEDLAQSVNYMLRELGQAERSLGEVAAFIGDGARMLVRRALPPQAQSELERALGLFRAHYRDHLLVHTRPYEGILGVLAVLGDLPLAVATNKPADLARDIVRGLGWTGHFRVVAGGDTVATQKPEPEVLWWVAAELGVPPERLLMVGDGSQDIGAGKNAGTLTCAALWGCREPSAVLALSPDFVAREPSELPRLVGR